MIIPKIQQLVEELNGAGLRYCHWKSNFTLHEALAGQTDIDLLIARDQAQVFRALLFRLGFRPVVSGEDAVFPAMEHYYALDEETGVLVHVHSYYRAITGESLAKSFRLPIESMLLQHTRLEGIVPVPSKSAELIVFTLRMMLKHISPFELVLLYRDWKNVKREIQWLLEGASLEETLRLVNEWLPSIDSKLFSDCLSALQKPSSLLRRVILANRLRAQLGIYARAGVMQSWLSGMVKFSKMAFRRLTRSKKGMLPQSGGVVIAFVGPEATGKSTLLGETSRWLGAHFSVQRLHAGKPKSTLLSFGPNLVLPALRSLLPGYRSGNVELQYNPAEQAGKPKKIFPLIFGIRSALLAYDRRVLLARAYTEAANGNIVLCDRYPSVTEGAPDSPQLSQYTISQKEYPLHFWLAHVEKQLYEEIPAPDLIISLSVPVEVAIFRNKNRGKEEPEDYVRRRHAQRSSLVFEKTTVVEVNTDQPIEKSILEVKQAVWKVL